MDKRLKGTKGAFGLVRNGLLSFLGAMERRLAALESNPGGGAHASTHATGGSDPVSPSSIGALSGTGMPGYLAGYLTSGVLRPMLKFVPAAVTIPAQETAGQTQLEQPPAGYGYVTFSVMPGGAFVDVTNVMVSGTTVTVTCATASETARSVTVVCALLPED